MSTVMARRIASTPKRTAAQTWDKIMEILAPDPASDARRELEKATGVACAAIASEATKESAIVVWGGGPRVRVYCVFDEDAVTGDGVSEDALPKSPTQDGWRMSMPCLPEDVRWCSDKLSAVSEHITARSLEDTVDDEAAQAAAPRTLSISTREFLKP